MRLQVRRRCGASSAAAALPMVENRFLASDGVADRLQLRERELADHGLDVRAGEAVVRTDEGGVWLGVQSRQYGEVVQSRSVLDAELFWSMII
jgi:hypothetical protein